MSYNQFVRWHYLPILYSEPDMPLQSNPSDNRREKCDQDATDDNDEHGLRDRETHRFLEVSHQTSKIITCTTIVPKNVLGVCQFARFNDAIDQNPKKLNQPHVRRSGGRGIRSRLLHASVCSCFSSSPRKRIFALIAASRYLNVIFNHQ